MKWIRDNAFSILIALGVVVAALVVVVVLEVSSSNTKTCQLVRGLSHVESEFIRTDAVDRKGALTTQQRTQDIKGFEKIIAAHSLLRQVRAQQTLDNRTINYWRFTLVPETKSIVAAANCGK